MPEAAIEKIKGSAENPRLNAVFVHGLGGNARNTWLYEHSRSWIEWAQGERKQSCFWPEWLVEDHSGLAVYALGYPADKMGWNSGWPIEERRSPCSTGL